MLSFNQMKSILDSYPFEQYSYKDGRINYRYQGKQIVKELTRTGNCYVWGRDIKQGMERGYNFNSAGWIKDVPFMTEQEVKELLDKVLEYREKFQAS